MSKRYRRVSFKYTHLIPPPPSPPSGSGPASCPGVPCLRGPFRETMETGARVGTAWVFVPGSSVHTVLRGARTAASSHTGGLRHDP